MLVTYDGVPTATMAVNVTDNDIAKVQVFRSGGSTRVSEDGTLTDSYELVLTSEPVDDVIVRVNAGDQLQVAGVGGTMGNFLDLTFTPQNWNVRQKVSVMAIDDDVAEGNPLVSLENREHGTLITHSVSSQNDEAYDRVGGAVDSVAVQIKDNDSPGIEILVSGGPVTVLEGGVTSGSYQIRLLSKPTADVSVTFEADAQLVATTTSPLVFTTNDWNVAQTVELQAFDDAIAEGVHAGQITHTADSLDPFYVDVSGEAVNVTITDNDTAGILITNGDALEVTEGGLGDTYQVKLTSQPIADVTVTVSSGSQLVTDTESLVFTPASWMKPQTVTVSAYDDMVAEGVHTAKLGHVADSDDPAYVPDPDLNPDLIVPLRTVTINDNDTPDVIVSADGTTLAVAEGGATTQYTIALGSEPTSRVTVTLQSNDQIDVIPDEIVFDASDWNQPRVITVRAIDDAIDEESHSSLISHFVASEDGNYNAPASVSSVAISIADNDTADILITETVGSTDVWEAGASDIYVVKLQSQPTSNVTVPDADGRPSQNLAVHLDLHAAELESGPDCRCQSSVGSDR